MAKKIKMRYKLVNMSKARPSGGASLGVLDMGALTKQVKQKTKCIYSAKSRADSIRYAKEIFRGFAGRNIPPSILGKGPDILLAWAQGNLPKVKGTKKPVTFDNPGKSLRRDSYNVIEEIHTRIRKEMESLSWIDGQLSNLEKMMKC